MRFKVTGINEEEDWEDMEYDEIPSNSNKPKTKDVVRLQCDKPRCSITIPLSELGNVQLKDTIEVTFGKPNIAKA